MIPADPRELRVERLRDSGLDPDEALRLVAAIEVAESAACRRQAERAERFFAGRERRRRQAAGVVQDLLDTVNRRTEAP